jgi:hypothetical protein
LVEDYKNRLAGQNGIADLMNALRNAHIGFFDSQSQVAVGKMLKRIE